MRRNCIVAAFVVACTPATPAPKPASGMGADIAYLASPALAGREAGTPGADSAAQYIARRYEQLGIPPAFRFGCGGPMICSGSYFQAFNIQRGTAQNVAALIVGDDSLLREQFVVIGAHYDHLGRSPTWSLDRDRGFVTRPGADDNASGTAVAMELARRLQQHPAHRSILVVNFDAEEIGLVGSRVLLSEPPVPKRAIRFMVNLDMVGRLRDNGLTVEGLRDRATRAMIDSVLRAAKMRADFIANEDRSDHATFLADSIEALSLSTGYHEDYHKASDTPARIDLQGLEIVADVAERIVRRIANR